MEYWVEEESGLYYICGSGGLRNPLPFYSRHEAEIVLEESRVISIFIAERRREGLQ